MAKWILRSQEKEGAFAEYLTERNHKGLAISLAKLASKKHYAIILEQITNDTVESYCVFHNGICTFKDAGFN